MKDEVLNYKMKLYCFIWNICILNLIWNGNDLFLIICVIYLWIYIISCLYYCDIVLYIIIKFINEKNLIKKMCKKINKIKDERN